MTIKELKKLKLEEIEKEILIQTKNLYEITIKVKTGEEKNTTLIKNQKKEIARLKTVENEKLNEENISDSKEIKVEDTQPDAKGKENE